MRSISPVWDVALLNAAILCIVLASRMASVDAQAPQLFSPNNPFGYCAPSQVYQKTVFYNQQHTNTYTKTCFTLCLTNKVLTNISTTSDPNITIAVVQSWLSNTKCFIQNQTSGAELCSGVTNNITALNSCYTIVRNNYYSTLYPVAPGANISHTTHTHPMNVMPGNPSTNYLRTIPARFPLGSIVPMVVVMPGIPWQPPIKSSSVSSMLFPALAKEVNLFRGNKPIMNITENSTAAHQFFNSYHTKYTTDAKVMDAMGRLASNYIPGSSLQAIPYPGSVYTTTTSAGNNVYANYILGQNINGPVTPSLPQKCPSNKTTPTGNNSDTGYILNCKLTVHDPGVVQYLLSVPTVDGLAKTKDRFSLGLSLKAFPFTNNYKISPDIMFNGLFGELVSGSSINAHTEYWYPSDFIHLRPGAGQFLHVAFMSTGTINAAASGYNYVCCPTKVSSNQSEIVFSSVGTGMPSAGPLPSNLPGNCMPTPLITISDLTNINATIYANIAKFFPAAYGNGSFAFGLCAFDVYVAQGANANIGNYDYVEISAPIQEIVFPELQTNTQISVPVPQFTGLASALSEVQELSAPTLRHSFGLLPFFDSPRTVLAPTTENGAIICGLVSCDVTVTIKFVAPYDAAEPEDVVPVGSNMTYAAYMTMNTTGALPGHGGKTITANDVVGPIAGTVVSQSRAFEPTDRAYFVYTRVVRFSFTNYSEFTVLDTSFDFKRERHIFVMSPYWSYSASSASYGGWTFPSTALTGHYQVDLTVHFFHPEQYSAGVNTSVTVNSADSITAGYPVFDFTSPVIKGMPDGSGGSVATTPTFPTLPNNPPMFPTLNVTNINTGASMVLNANSKDGNSGQHYLRFDLTDFQTTGVYIGQLNIMPSSPLFEIGSNYNVTVIPPFFNGVEPMWIHGGEWSGYPVDKFGNLAPTYDKFIVSVIPTVIAGFPSGQIPRYGTQTGYIKVSQNNAFVASPPAFLRADYTPCATAGTCFMTPGGSSGIALDCNTSTAFNLGTYSTYRCYFSYAINSSIPYAANTATYSVSVQIAPAASASWVSVTDTLQITEEPFLSNVAFRADPSVIRIDATTVYPIVLDIWGPVAVSPTVTKLVVNPLTNSLSSTAPSGGIPTPPFRLRTSSDSGSLSGFQYPAGDAHVKWAPHHFGEQFHAVLGLAKKDVPSVLPATYTVQLYPALWDGAQWVFLPESEFPSSWGTPSIDLHFIDGTSKKYRWQTILEQAAINRERRSNESDATDHYEPVKTRTGEQVMSVVFLVVLVAAIIIIYSKAITTIITRKKLKKK